MNKINRLFAERGERKLLSLYFCAGCPTAEGTADVILAMQRKGIDMIEVGMPFSDPLADGPVIQAASSEAIRNGMTTSRLFGQLATIRDKVRIPLVLMGYLNIVMAYGVESFFMSCRENGVAGVIIPDLPLADYLATVKPLADKYDVRVIMMITPETDDSRIKLVDDNTDSFIYMVSSAGVTGEQTRFGEAKQAYFSHVASLGLRNPLMAGFGISNRQTLESAQRDTAGAIIGSKFVTLLNRHGNPDKALDELFCALEK